MPTPTYTPLATVTLGTAAASVTFSSIPATYRDLILVSDCRHASTGPRDLLLRPNNDSGNQTAVVMYGDGTSAASVTTSAIVAQYNSNNENQVGIAQVMDYSATDKHKTVLTRTNNSSTTVSAQAGRWASTSAVTSIVLLYSGVNIEAGSRFDLYGVIA